MKEKEQLRKKEEQLRKKEEQLREKQLVLLRLQQATPPSSGGLGPTDGEMRPRFLLFSRDVDVFLERRGVLTPAFGS